MKTIAGLVLVLALSGCSLVVSEHAVGEKAVHAAMFGGHWQAVDPDKGGFTLAVKDAPGGVLTMAGGEDEDEQVFELREKHGWVFANRIVAEEGATGFAWHRVEMAPDGRSFRVWTPDVAAFEDLIVAGTLKGRIIDRGQAQPGAAPNQPAQNQGGSGTIVVISEKDDGWIQEMMAGRFGKVFETDSPVSYLRVPALGEDDAGE